MDTPDPIDPILQANFSPFTYAVSIGDDKTVQFLLETGISPEEADTAGNSALCLAIRNGHLKTAAHLLDFGADIYRADAAGNVPATLCRQGNNEQMQFLILGMPVAVPAPEPAAVASTKAARKMAVRVRPAMPRSIPAISSVFLYTLGVLLIIGCFRLRATYKERESLSIVDAVNAADVEQVGRLLTSGISANVADMNGGAILSYAARNGKGEVVRLLLGNHADPNLGDPRGMSQLSSAMQHHEIIQNLLDSGANPNREDSAHRTLLSYACLSVENAQVVTDLLKHRANPNVAGFNGPPLVTLIETERLTGNEASSLEFVDTVKALLAAVADATATDSAGSPVIVWAAEYSDPRVVADLIKHGASSGARDKTGRSPLHACAARGNADIARQLFVAGADANGEDLDGNTPLFSAVACAIDRDTEEAAVAMAGLLKQHGAKPGHKNARGETAAAIARAHGLNRLASAIGS